jgi:hypothetical protein
MMQSAAKIFSLRENGFDLSGNAYRRNLTYHPGNR